MEKQNANPGPLWAGNTCETLAPTRIEASVKTTVATDSDASAVPSNVTVQDTDDSFDDENTFDISRAEFNELRDAFLRLYARVDKYNEGAPHRI